MADRFGTDCARRSYLGMALVVRSFHFVTAMEDAINKHPLR